MRRRVQHWSSSQNDENRFNPAFVAAINKALDSVEASTDAAALVTVGQGKFYSNGLDLDWVIENQAAGMEFVKKDFLGLLRRVLLLPIPTVAALSGHTFAGGCLFAMVHDYRLMRTGRGLLCMNEIDIPAPLSPGMAAVLRYASRRAARAPHGALTGVGIALSRPPPPPFARSTRMNARALRDCLLQGKRFTAGTRNARVEARAWPAPLTAPRKRTKEGARTVTEAALEYGIVDLITPADHLLAAALELASRHSAKGSVGVWLGVTLARDAYAHPRLGRGRVCGCRRGPCAAGHDARAQARNVPRRRHAHGR